MSNQTVMPLRRRNAKAKDTEGTPRYHVLSLRVSEEEKQEFLELLTTKCSSMSEMMRQALELWKAELDARRPPLSHHGERG
ncbi:MAG: hypothetical protein HYS23_02035 [Geobacter sp.]|nr:hypothetical protein [Geobacter sp.]